MAVVIETDPDVLILRLRYRDVYGQDNTREYLLGGGTTDLQITDFVAAIDLITNCRIIDATVRTIRKVTGMKGAAVNALERKVSDALEIAFDATDPVDALKTITRSIIVPGLIAAVVDLTGSPVTTNANLNVIVGIENSQMAVKGADGNYYVGIFTYNRDESHQVSFADVVDTV